MSRRMRCSDAGYVYHVLNRAAGRATLFNKAADYEALQWLTVTHVRRWHAHYHTEGTGPIYQGRFKSFPIQQDEHYYAVCRYAERNARRARLVKRAENWRWSSLWHRCQATGVPWLGDGPLPLPANWIERVNEAQTEAELSALRQSVACGAPFGEVVWQKQTATALGLASGLFFGVRLVEDAGPVDAPRAAGRRPAHIGGRVRQDQKRRRRAARSQPVRRTAHGAPSLRQRAGPRPKDPARSPGLDPAAPPEVPGPNAGRVVKTLALEIQNPRIFEGCRG